MAENRLSDSCLANSRWFLTRGTTCSLPSTSLALVADLVRWYLLVRTLVQFKLVSKEWRAWCDGNLLQIAKERRKDASRDWYFPIAFGNNHRNPIKWYGVHQWTERQDTLPDLDFLPLWNDFPRFDYGTAAVSCGLLVLRTFLPTGGFILIVCNPLSKKWRRLPRHSNCKDREMFRAYQGDEEDMHMHSVVDDLSNQYKLIRLSPNCVNVYSSSTNRWVCSPSNNPGT